MIIGNNLGQVEKCESVKSGRPVKFDYANDDHLRLLIGNIRALIRNGRGIYLADVKFVNLENSWSISGAQIGGALYKNYNPNGSDSEKLAYRLWPKKAIFALVKSRFDIHNDDHLRKLIGSVDNLVKNNKGIPLIGVRFVFKNRGWSIPWTTIGRELFGTSQPSIKHSEELALRLWPEEARNLLGGEKFDYNNDDHLRRLIGSVDKLIKNGKGRLWRLTKFVCQENGWRISSIKICRALYKAHNPNICHAELLARRLWPQEAAEMLKE